MLQAANGFLLDLPGPLAGQAKLLADFLERARGLAVKPEVARDDVGLAPRQGRERALHLPAQRVAQQARVRRVRRVVPHNVEQAVFLTLHEGRVHRDVAARNFQRVGHFGRAQLQQLGDLVGRGLALELLLELGKRAVDFVERAHAVQRQAHDAALLGQGLQDALADPPHGVGDELEALRLVEALGRLDQPQVALVDEVAQGQALVLVLLGHGHDEAQVGFRQLFEGHLVAFADALGQFDFLVNRHQAHFADFLQVLVQRLAFAVGDLLANF